MRVYLIGALLFLIVSVLGLSGQALPDCGGNGGGNGGHGGNGGGGCLKLDVTPNVPVSGGDVVSICVSNGHEDHYAFLAFGWQQGSYSLWGWDLDLIPMKTMYLGQFSASGEISFDVTVPSPIPPAWSGHVLYAQGGSVGEGCCQGTWCWKDSDLDSVEFL